MPRIAWSNYFWNLANSHWVSDKNPNIDSDLRDDFNTAAKVLWMDTSKQSTSGQASTLIVKSATNIARSLGKPPNKSASKSARTNKHLKHRDKRKTGINTGSNVSTDIYAPTGSQLHTLQHGADMCKLNELNHSFGQTYDTDDTIYEYLSTYGMEPADFSSACLNGKLKPVEICLQVEDDLTQETHKEARDNDTSTKSKPLEAKDIEYDPTLIADLKDHDAEQRKGYFKAIQSELGALTALGFAQIAIIPENRDGISTRFVLKVKRKADGTY